MKPQKKKLSSINTRKKFVAIGKVHDTTGFKFVKYRFNDLAKFQTWFTGNFRACWFNVYSNRGVNKRAMVATWGNKKGLVYC